MCCDLCDTEYRYVMPQYRPYPYTTSSTGLPVHTTHPVNLSVSRKRVIPGSNRQRTKNLYLMVPNHTTTTTTKEY